MTKRILIADDDRAILDAITMILELEGYEVKTTHNGATVKALSTTFAPHLLLLDIWMSGYDGKEICQALKADKQTAHIPIIIISANKDVAKISDEAGANGFLAKPFDMKDLLTTIVTFSSK